jgi:hypothetical protein
MDCMSRKHRLQCNIEIPAEPAIRSYFDFIPKYARNIVNSLGGVIAYPLSLRWQ